MVLGVVWGFKRVDHGHQGDKAKREFFTSTVRSSSSSGGRSIIRLVGIAYKLSRNERFTTTLSSRTWMPSFFDCGRGLFMSSICDTRC